MQPLAGSLGGKLKFVPGSVGVLFPGMEARIVREDGTEADINELGELWLRSGNISTGYWKNDKANKETFKDGWLRTGDYFRVNESGYFWYHDRVKVWNSSPFLSFLH
jgi:long-subunit acyl-CoA synthetase (AMP-forming)